MNAEQRKDEEEGNSLKTYLLVEKNVRCGPGKVSIAVAAGFGLRERETEKE
jgi:hypothetical protein